MSNEKVKNVIVISDDDEDKSAKKDHLPDVPSSDGPSSSNKQTEANKTLKITVEQNQSKQNSTKVVIEIDDLPSSQETAKEEAYRVFLEEIKDESFTLEFLQLIELCLMYECSDGMTRILKRNLIPQYRAANRDYVESLAFQKVLENSLKKLRKEPYYKFSTIKNVCELLKYNKVKKRVDFVTLDNKVSEKRKTQYNSQVQKKRPHIEVIDLVGTETPTSTNTIIDVDSLDNDDTEVIYYDEEDYKQNDDVQIIDGDKENNKSLCETSKQTLESNLPPPNAQNVLEPSPNQVLHKYPISQKEYEELKIRTIEKEIENLKKAIKIFDEMEVSEDNGLSPYLYNDRLQTRIVELYKELCQLKGETPARRQCKGIQLAVIEGHPPGPARTLQDFMNERILNLDTDDLPFPDFVDVIKCVTKANVEDELGWGKQRILATAQLLFSQIGMALQERRKQREWRDLCRHVEGPLLDPADEDPELLARLEANRLLAEQKESDILEYYAKLESETKVNKKITVLARKWDLARQVSHETLLNNEQGSQSGLMLEFEVPFLETTEDPQTTEDDKHNETKDIKPVIVPKPIDPDIEIEISDSEDYSSSDNECSDFELDDFIPKSTEGASKTESLVASTAVNNENNIDTKTTVILKDEAEKSTIGATKNIITDATSSLTEKSSLDNILGVSVKSEPGKAEQEDDTLKFLLELDKNKDKGFIIKTSIFDVEEPVTFIEISSSSESESESEDVCDEEKRKDDKNVENNS